MEEARRARWHAERGHIAAVQYAHRINSVLGRMLEGNVRQLVHEAPPETFTIECEPGSCPLSKAAGEDPWLALRMLDRGADPAKAPLGGGTLLHEVIADEEKIGTRGSIQLFKRLLALGVDPGGLIAWRTRLAPSAYAASLLAVVLSLGKAAKPYLRALLTHPGFEDAVLSQSPGHPRLTAAEFARRTGADWALKRVEGWGRWSRNRRAWVGAVLRAPRR